MQSDERKVLRIADSDIFSVPKKEAIRRLRETVDELAETLDFCKFCGIEPLYSFFGIVPLDKKHWCSSGENWRGCMTDRQKDNPIYAYSA